MSHKNQKYPLYIYIYIYIYIDVDINTDIENEENMIKADRYKKIKK